jgi:hypothetical protein
VTGQRRLAASEHATWPLSPSTEFDLAPIPEPGTWTPASGAGNHQVPVQVIVRNELPQGSSVHRRLAAGTLTSSGLGLRGVPAAGEKRDPPLIEYATMLEDVNRLVSELEAGECLAQVPQQRLRRVAVLHAGGGDQDSQQ